MRRHRHLGLLIAGIALVVVGVCGAVVTGALLGSNIAQSSQRNELGQRSQRNWDDETGDGFSSNGERIFLTGVGHNGRIRIEWDPSGSGFGGMMGERGGTMYARFGCATCHGRDGQGRELGMMSSIDAPDIRYDTLTSPHEDESDGWTDKDIEEAIREGTEPNGDELDPMMPRWQMDDQDVKDTIGYLKELNR